MTSMFSEVPLTLLKETPQQETVAEHEADLLQLGWCVTLGGQDSETSATKLLTPKQYILAISKHVTGSLSKWKTLDNQFQNLCLTSVELTLTNSIK